MEYPLITLGLTCFNAQDTIGRAIQGLLDQDYPHKEIVIINDCSTDNSASVIEAAIRDVSYARLVTHEKNMGVAGSLNSLLQHAKGEFIAISDDDDISLPHRISTQYKRIADYRKKTGVRMVVCWGSGYKQYSNGYRAPFKAIGSQANVPVGKDLIAYQLYLPRNPDVFYGNGTPGCTMMVPREVYDAVGPYDLQMRRTEDTDFALRLALIDGHFIGTVEDVVIQTASVGHDKRPDVGYKSEIALIEKYKGVYENPRRAEYAKDWIRLRFHHFGHKRIPAMLALAKLLIKYPLWTVEQFFRSAPKRLIHEWKMSRKKAVKV